MKKINLNQLTFDNFYYWPSSLKNFILFVFAILLFSLNYELILSSAFHRYSYLDNEQLGIKMEFEKKQKLANLPAYQQQLHRVETLYGMSLKQLVKENEVSSLLNEISQTAVSSGLIVEYFAPIATEKKESPKFLIFRMEVIGEYHQLSLFLVKISELNHLVTFESFAVVKEDKLLHMKISAKIYRYYE